MSRVVTVATLKSSFGRFFVTTLFVVFATLPASAKTDKVVFQAKTLDGKPVTSQSLRGKIVLLDFWATWCGPCRKALPAYQKLQKQAANQDFVVIGISVDKEREAITEFIERYKISLPIVHDRNHVLAKKFKPSTMPTSYLVARDGRLVQTLDGFRPGHVEEVRRYIQSHKAKK